MHLLPHMSHTLFCDSSSYGTIGTIQAGSCQSFQRSISRKAIHCLLEAPGSAGLLTLDVMPIKKCQRLPDRFQFQLLPELLNQHLLRFADFLFLPEHCFSLTNVMALSHVITCPQCILPQCHPIWKTKLQPTASKLLRSACPHLDWSWHRSSCSRSQLQDLHQSH